MRYVILLLILVAGKVYTNDHDVEFVQPKQVAESVYPFPACLRDYKQKSQIVEACSDSNPHHITCKVIPATGFRPLPMEYG